MPQNRYVVTVRLLGDREYQWFYSTMEAARNGAAEIGLRGFFVGANECKGHEFISPHLLAHITARLNPALVCPKCSIAEIVDAGGLCVDCSLALMCGKCGQIEKATDKKYCAACAVEVLCKKCGVVDRLKGMLYCKGCEKIALGEMAALGYLVPTSPNSTGTRKNVPHRGMISEGNWENGVRAGEDRNE